MRYTLILLLLVPGLLFGQSELIPRDQFFTEATRAAFKISPDGNHLYFRQAPENDLFRMDASPKATPVKIQSPDNLRQFVPLRAGVLLICKDSLSSLFHYAHSGESQKINLNMEATDIRFLRATSASPDVIALDITSPGNGTSGIYRLDIRSKELTRMHDPFPMNQIFLDGDLQPVAGMQSNDLGGNNLLVLNPKTGKWKTLISHPFTVDMFIGGFSRILGVSDDGNKVWYTSNLETDKSKLYELDRVSGTEKMVSEDGLVDLLPFGASSDAEGNITSVVGLFAGSRRKVISKEHKDDFEFLEAQLEGDLSYGGHSFDGSKWLIREFTGGPERYYLYDRANKKLDYLTNGYPDLEGKKLATRNAFSVHTSDNIDLPVHVYLPSGSDKDGDGIPDKPLPTIMYVHGGPWVGVVHWNQYFHWRNFQLLANRGYAVINCEFRGSTGLGKAFTDLATEAWGSDMTRDKKEIADWAIEMGIAQKEKVGIWGWSYGGYAALAGPAFYPETYACAVSMYGISDLEAFGKIDFANNNFWQERVGNAFEEADAKMLRKHSPISKVRDFKAPVLMTTGSKDARVPQVQMDTMAAALRKANKDVIYFYYPDEVHDYQDPESWISFWAITEKFLAEHLGGSFQPAKEDLKKGNYVIVEGSEKINGG